MVCVVNGENRVGDVRVRLDAGVRSRTGRWTRLRASPRPPAGKNWPSLEAVRPVPQKAAIGSAAWASTTMDNARSYASPSTCQRAMRINSQNPCVVVASAILRRPRLIPSASSTLSRPMRSRQGDPVRRCVKASVNLVGCDGRRGSAGGGAPAPSEPVTPDASTPADGLPGSCQLSGEARPWRRRS